MRLHERHGGVDMNISRSWLLGALVALSGCVHGSGCLFLQPIKHTLTGRIHFRSFPAPDGIDNVPVLVLDRTAYVYSPAHSYQCMSATDVQLVGEVLHRVAPAVIEQPGLVRISDLTRRERRSTQHFDGLVIRRDEHIHGEPRRRRLRPRPPRASISSSSRRGSPP